MENASRTFLNAVRKSIRQIRTAIGATPIDPKLLTAAKRLQYDGYLRREETNAAILALSKNGISIKQIVRRTGHITKLVRLDPQAYLTDVLERIVSGRTKSHQLHELLAWNWKAARQRTARAAA